MYYLGVDVSKSKLDCAVLDQDRTVIQEVEICNTFKAIKSYFTKLTKGLGVDFAELFVCVENTGIYGEPLKAMCVELGVNLWEENALKIKKASHDIRGKSDAKDALRIADYCLRYADLMELYQPPSEVLVRLKELTEIRTDLITRIQAMENQIREAKAYAPAKYKLLNKHFKAPITAMKKQIKQLEKDITETVRSDQQIHTNLKLIQSVPGVGMYNAVMFIVVTRNFTRFASAKHLASYAGVAPFPNRSGKMVRKDRVSSHANKKMKQLLHMAALATITRHPEMRAYYERKVAEGKPRMLVINAVRAKIVHRVWAVVKRQTPYVTETPHYPKMACVAS